MERVRTYRDLIVWRKSVTLAKTVYAMTARMPESERYGLMSQMRRAAVSIPSNIAEGHARQSSMEYLRYLRMARGSLAELATQHEIARDLGLLGGRDGAGDAAGAEAARGMEEVDRILQAVIRRIGERVRAQRRNGPGDAGPMKG